MVIIQQPERDLNQFEFALHLCVFVCFLTCCRRFYVSRNNCKETVEDAVAAEGSRYVSLSTSSDQSRLGGQNDRRLEGADRRQKEHGHAEDMCDVGAVGTCFL